MKKTNDKIPIYIVDAFTNKRYKGNPAAVCILSHRLSKPVMQSIASEMNLSETAFLTLLSDKTHMYNLRWFTPKVEVPLCGHATLATSSVLFYDIKIKAKTIFFRTKSGILSAKKIEQGILLNFPVDDPVSIKPPLELLKTLKIKNFENVMYGRKTETLLVHLHDAKYVKSISPDFEQMKLAQTDKKIHAVIVTAKGNKPYDFISRFFAPKVGVNEDPVTGAAHTVLTPYWSKILNKTELHAYQASSRGGQLIVHANLDKSVDLIGKAIIVLKGHFIM